MRYVQPEHHPFLGGGGTGHSAYGGGLQLGPYWGTVKLLAPALDMTDTPGDTIKIHSHYYKSEAPVDYGTISPDGRWAFCTGAGADVDGQIVGFELHEPGNVVPIYFHNTSRVGWDVKEYVYVTPDSTKIIQYCSDMLGDGDMYVVAFQRPEPPRDIRVDDTEEGLTVSWQPPRQSKEVWAYNAYHSMGRTTGFEKVNPQPVENTRFVHRGADPRSVYLVTAVDNGCT